MNRKKAKTNVIIYGGTTSGKTTPLNAIDKKIPMQERVITTEEVKEIPICPTARRNAVHVLSWKDDI